MNKRFDKFMVSVYTKEKLEDKDYENVKKAFKEVENTEEILSKEFSTFNKIIFKEEMNRFFVYFDNIDESNYDSYIKVFMIETL